MCPYCKSNNIIDGLIALNTKAEFYKVYCNDCGKVWVKKLNYETIL